MLSITRELREVERPSWLELVALLRLGDRRAFDAALDEFRDSPLVDQWFQEAFARQFGALAAFLDGDLDQALAEATLMPAPYEGETAEGGDGLPESGGDLDLLHGLAAVNIWRDFEAGALSQACEQCEVAAAFYPSVGGYRAAQAVFLLADGERERALELTQGLFANDAPELGHELSRPAGLAFLAEACAELELTDGAPAVYNALQPFAGQIIVLASGIICYGATDRFLGMLAPLLPGGHIDIASRHFDAAEELESHLRSDALVARTRYWHAVTLQRHGSSHDDDIVELLNEAEESCPAQMLQLQTAIRRQRALLARGARRR